MRHLLSALVFVFLGGSLHAQSNMIAELPRALDTAVGICLDYIDGNRPRQPGRYVRTESGYVRRFAESHPGVQAEGPSLNGSKTPRVQIFFREDRVCSLYVLRLGGNYARHFAQTRAAFERRGWDYKSRGLMNLTRGERLLSFGGSTAAQARGVTYMTNFTTIEWVRDARGKAVRRYAD
ncbi:MAG: hypothetical protein AAFY38_09190 [Pseudomonadota bacterium]